MKKLTILIVLFSILVSCSSDDDSLPNNYEGKWQLMEMSGSEPNSVTTGSEMQWQEFYILNIDGTFIKSRETDGVVIEVTGTYNLVDSSNGMQLECIYETANELIGTCSQDRLREDMNFLSENTFYSNWQQCDGPGLRYEKS